MMADDGKLRASLSPNGDLVAIAPPSNGSLLRILILNSQNGQLQTTLTKRPTQGEENILSCLKIIFIDDSNVAVLFSDKVLVWDLTRGVVDYTIEAKKNEFHDMAAHGGYLYLLVALTGTSKLQVHQYQHANLQRKIKAGKGEARGLAVTDNYIIVRHDETLRILSQENGNKVAKCTGLMDDAGAAANKHIGAVLSAGKVELIELSTGNRLAGSFVAAENAQLSMNESCSQVYLTDGTTVVAIHANNVKQIGKINIEDAGTLDHSIVMVSDKPNQSLVVVLSRAGHYQVHPVQNIKDDINLSWKEKDFRKEDDDTDIGTIHKRKANNITVLGPAQAGGEAMKVTDEPSKKRTRRDSEVDDAEEAAPNIAERLLQLQEALDKEEEEEEDQSIANRTKSGFQPRKATTESLTELLQQALQSSDDAMLELALDVRDQKIVQETCEQLPMEQLPKLMNALTTRLANKPARAEQLSHWISILLKTGRIRSIGHLQPLRNLLQERIESFPALLQLEGRLNMIGHL